MGDYLTEMNANNFGDQKVRSALKDLKDLHRNPLIHPEHSIETAEAAIALMNGVHNAMVYMMQEMPAIAPTPAIPVAGATPVTTPSALSATPCGDGMRLI